MSNGRSRLGIELNNRRAERGQLALDRYISLVGNVPFQAGDEEEQEDCLTDLTNLLVDLMHLAREEGLNFELSMTRAEVHFLTEVDEEDSDD